MGKPFIAMEGIAIARIYFNDQPQDTVSFTWDHAGRNCIGLSARAINYARMDNLVIRPFDSFSVSNADLTGEGGVDLSDFVVLAAHWLSGYTAPCLPADLSGDCHVDLRDLEVLAAQ